MANAGPIFTNVVGRFGKFRKRRPISSITSSIGKRFGDTIGVHWHSAALESPSQNVKHVVDHFPAEMWWHVSISEWKEQHVAAG